MKPLSQKLQFLISAVLGVTAFAVPAQAIQMGSININQAIGADAFYDIGIYGQGATVVNIEGGLPWAGHTAFSSNPVDEVYNGSYKALTTGNLTVHATTCSMLLAGEATVDTNEYWKGVAYEATLKAGNIASSIAGSAFGFYDVDIWDTYTHFTISGADVISSSYGGDYTAAAGSNQLINIINSVAARYTETSIFFAAGNAYNAGTVGIPAVAHNVITVGALDTTLYNRASYSSYGPSDFYLPTSASTGTVIYDARASVDIVAPGTGITTTATLNNPDGRASGQGTSYATPITAGGATLMASLSRDLGWGEESRDTRVIKAVLLNSASKSVNGWTNNTNPAATVQTKDANGSTVTFSNVALTTQALDYEYGAGALDLGTTLKQYYSDTAYNPDNSSVKAGWTFGYVGKNTSCLANEIITVAADTTFTVTLTWLADYLENDSVDSLSGTALADLNLEVWKTDELGNIDTLIASSRTLYDSVEHLSLNITEEMYLRVRVLHDGMTYDLRTVPSVGENFGLAWSGASDVTLLPRGASSTPEPSTYAFWAGTLALALTPIARRKKKTQRHRDAISPAPQGNRR
ncbi:MAG: S8 family serine peptidase, partial [Puniceicoccales bacterium]|nr:S8 family serine peptidase [Puniceicoccales bacterium]